MNRLKKIFHTAEGVRLFAALLVVFGARVALADSSTFTVSGNWQAPEGVTAVRAEAWGGGGGGGGTNSASKTGGGGAGGNYALKNAVSVTPGNNYTVTVGSAGTGGAAGVNGFGGGGSWFSSPLSVNASGGLGGGGAIGSFGAGGITGSGSTGDLIYNGGGGYVGTANFGGGGGSSAGTAANGVAATSDFGATAPAGGGPGGNGGATSANGSTPAIGPGGGGGGGGKNTTSGGSGYVGQVVLTYYPPKPGTPAVSAFYPSQLSVTWAATSTLRGYLVEASTAANFTGTIASTRTPSVALSTLALSGLSANSTYYIRVGTLWNFATYYAQAIYANTMMEDPSSVYIDEVGTTTILASAYASTFTNIDQGNSGVAIDTSTDFYIWGSTGNYWAAKANMPSARYDLAGAAAGGKFYAIGGGGAGAKLNEAYDPVTNSWSSKAQMPTGRDRLYTEAIGGKIYAVGGYSAPLFSVTEVYDPAANSWVTKSSMPAGSALGAGAAVNGKLYIMGGPSANYRYDPDSDTWTSRADVPTARNYPAAAALNGKIYLVGGNYGGYLTVTEEYDPVLNVWSTRAPMSVARQGLMVVAVGGKLHAIGGYNGVELDTHEEYDPLSNAWTVKPGVPMPRYKAAAAAVDGKIYIAGGNGGGDSAMEYNPGVSRKFAGFQPNTLYNFSAKSRNQAGLVGAQSIPWVSTYTLAAAGLPWWGAPVFTNLSQNNLTVNWSSGTPSVYNNPGATYKVQVSTLPDFSVLAGNANTMNLYYQFSGLPANATHYARVQAYNSGGMTDYAGLPLGSNVTAGETPSSFHFAEVSTWAITASAYASSLSSLGVGLSGVNLTTGAFYGDWVNNGNNWSLGPNMPTPRYGAAGASAGRKIYILGGSADGLNFLPTNEEYDPAANVWTTRTGMGQARYLLSAAVLSGRIYALGGYNSLAGGTLNTNEEYDPASNSWRARAPMPTARERLAAVSAGGRIYALGGYNSIDYAANEIYDPANNTWITGVAMPAARRSLAAAYLNGKIYAVGGNSGGYKSVNEEYDLASKTWSTKAAMPTPRDGLAAAVIGGKLYAVSGYNGSYLASNEVYDPNSNTWTPRAGLPAPRGDMAYAVLNGKLYLAGGNDGSALNSAYQYNPGVSKVFIGLQPNALYVFKAKARNQIGVETGDMGTFNAYTLAVATVPSGPAVQVMSPYDAQIIWSSGSQSGGYNGPNASYRVEASTLPNFSGELRWQNVWNDTQRYFGGLQPKTTYYFRVQAYNHDNITDYSWTVLGSTRMPAEPLGGTAVSTMAWNAQNFNWARAMARDSDGNLYLAYLKYYYGKFRVFLSRSADNGSTWADTTAVPIETAGDVPSVNSYDQYWPALAIDSQDVLHLVWGGTNNQLDASGGAEPKCVYSSAPAPGNNWNFYTKIPAHTYQGNEYAFNIAVDSNDGLHVVWAGEDAGGGGTSSIRYSSRAANGNWTSYALLNDDALQADFPALAIDDKDGLHIVAKRGAVGGSNTTPVISYSSRPPAGNWGSWTGIYTGVGGYHQSPPSLTIMADGTRFAAWSSADATYSNSQVKYSVAPPGGVWAPMAYVDTAIPEAPQANPAAAADAIGNVYVIWAGSDTKNPAINLKGSAYNGSAWDNIEGLTDEDSMSQIYPAVRWSGWRNNGGGIDVIWNTWDGTSSTATLRVMQGPDVPMSPGWSKTPWPVPPGCGYALNVKQDGAGDFTGIGQALNAVPQELSTTTCVVLRDAETYGEQVTVQGVQTGRWDANTSYRLIFMKDPTFISSGPVVSPPLSSTAAFHLINASVTVQGFTIAPANAIAYGILASSENITVSSVNIVSGGQIWNAGISFNKRGLLDHSSVTVQNATGVLLDRDLNTVSFSTIASAGSSYFALKVYNASSNTVTGSYISNAAGYGARIYGTAHYNSVSLSTVTGTGSTRYALSIDNGASNNEVAGCYLGNASGSALEVNHQSNHNIVSGSTASAAGSGSMGLYVYDSSSNTFSGSVFRAQDGYAVEFYGGAYGNAVETSTIENNSSASAALYLSGASSNTVTGSYIRNPGGTALYLYTGSANNTVALSTVTSGEANSYALYMSGASSNTVDQCYLANMPGYGAQVTNSDRNTIRRSTVESTGNGRNILKFSSSMNNLVEETSLSNGNGPGVYYYFSNFNELRDSYIYAYQSDDSALAFYEASTNTVSGSFAVNPAGYGARLMTNSDHNRVIDSTITASPSIRYGVELNGVEFNEFDGFYVQGATAVYITGSPVNIFRSGTLLAQAASGSGLALSGASGGIYLASSTVYGGAQGAGLLLDPGYTNKIELDSNTIAGGAYGMNIGAPGAGGRLQVSTISFQSLTPGATAINFMSGQVVSTFTGVDFGSGDVAVTVNGSALGGMSYIGMRQVTGARRGGYENDPAGYVYWDPAAAMLVGPPNNPDMLLPFVPPSPALHARAHGADSAAQYQYQVDTTDTMDSQGSTPLYDLTQAAAQAYGYNGAFSGQDAAFFLAGDSYLESSTATFVFYSTGTRLTPNAQYYWRARVKTKASGEYGAWTSTSSFFTEASASPWPVNDLAVTGVNLSSPSVQGVNVGFTVFANNVSTGMTPNGAAYNTAEWIFVKFSTQAGAEGTWNHATLSGGAAQPPDTLTLASDGKGVFVDHTLNVPNWNYASTVTWNYAADGVTGGNALVKVFAISMVKVPQGQFVYNAGGIGGAAYNNYGSGSQAAVTSPSQVPSGASVNWPNGYNSFYIMRYELTQGLYADFLNTIPSAAAAALYDYQAMFGDQMNNFGAYPAKYSTSDRFAVRNYLSTSDLWSFLSWAALRPLTEMEYEKAGRDITADTRTYPWGNTEPDAATYAPPNEGGTHMRNYANYGYVTGGLKILDSGRYMSGDVYRTPEQTGASPYGIADLAGNVIEQVINCSYLSVPANGNGSTLWPAGWPAADSDQKGWRGGAWFFAGEYTAVSNRLEAGWPSVDRYYYGGGRGGRTP